MRLTTFAWMLFIFSALLPSVAKPTQRPFIQRLDGSRISVSEAEALARKTLEEARVTGAQIAVLVKGKLVWSAAFGHRRLEPALPMARDTTTWAASITKGVFGTYVMMLVERGEFDLDKPITQQLPKGLETYEPYREKAVDLVRDPRWPKVTPRMLLAHTSGLSNFAMFEPDKKMHLQFEPGSRFLYSGEGLNLVQFALETQKQESLDQLMQEALFTPLGMSRTGLIYRQEFEANVADRYDFEENFRSKTQRFPARAAGSMTTSAEDLARFASALLGGKVIRPSTLRNMLKPYVQIRSLHNVPLAEDEGEGAEAAKVGLAYGMGWGLLTKTKFGPAFFKEGHGDGAQNYMVCFQRSKSCMILLTNSDNGEMAFQPLLERILGATVIPFEWEGYTRSYLEASRKRR